MVVKDKEEAAILLSGMNSSKLDSAVMENDGGRGEKTVELDLSLHDAVCDSDDLEEVQRIVDEQPSLIYLRDLEGHTPLHTVVINTDENGSEIAKILLGVRESGNVFLGVDRPELLNLQDSYNYTALHHAASNRQVELIRDLLKWGADPYIHDEKGNTPLHVLALEGRMISAIDSGVQLLNGDTKRSLINTMNTDNKTALHMAVDSKAAELVTFLLQPNNGFDLSLKDKSGKTILHYACSATEESEESCQILETIVHRFSPSYLNQVDNMGRTALHWATIQRLPQMTRILVGEDKMDVSMADNFGKTPLHYACQNGCYPRGNECVEALLNRPVPQDFDLIKYLFTCEDKEEHTPFTYACLNCPPHTVLEYLTIVPEPKFWLSGTYMALLYKECPLALVGLMNKAIKEDTERTSEIEDDILVDYGPVTGYEDPVKSANPQQETKYLKQGLGWEYETQKDVLLHPLIQLYTLRKWTKLRWIILTWVLWQVIWLGAFTTVIIQFYTGTSNVSAITYILTAIMIVYVFTSLLNESFEVCKTKCGYLASLSNWIQLARNCLALISIYPILAGDDEPAPWLKYSAATGILLAYILSMRDIGKLHSKIGLVVEVLNQVVIQIVQVLLYCSPLWIGFTLAFVVIFEDDATLNSFFPGPFVKVLVMMTGEFEYKDTLNVEGDKKMLHSHIVIRFIFFLAFLVTVPVAFFNLLTGFALDKVIELRERAKVGRIAEQLEHIYFIESILLTLRPLLQIIFSKERMTTWLRKLNVTTAWLDRTFKFYTIQREQLTRRSERKIWRKQEKTGESNMNSSTTSSFPFFRERKLRREVEDKIFALASTHNNK